jgi:hypothetical protein
MTYVQVHGPDCQSITVCSASTLTEELRISRPFSSQSREKREVSLRRTHTRNVGSGSLSSCGFLLRSTSSGAHHAGAGAHL